jgi:hypothetical protein
VAELAIALVLKTRGRLNKAVYGFKSHRILKRIKMSQIESEMIVVVQQIIATCVMWVVFLVIAYLIAKPPDRPIYKSEFDKLILISLFASMSVFKVVDWITIISMYVGAQ